MVLRKADVTWHFFATRIRSWLRISFETAAAISGVIPRDSFRSTSPVAASESSQSRNDADGQRRYRRKGRRVVAIDDQAGDLIVFVGDDGLLQELLQRNVRQRHPRRDHVLGAIGGDARQAIAGARRRGLGQEIAQIIEDIGGGIDDVTIDHGGSGPSARLPRRPAA